MGSEMCIRDRYAGLNVVVYDSGMNKVGTFVATEADTQIQFGDLTHMGARANDASGLVTYTFDWTAPSPTTSETYTMYYSGNSVNLNGNPGGDQYSAGSMEITVSIPSAVQMSETAITTVSLWIVPLLAVFSLLTLTSVTVWVKRSS